MTDTDKLREALSLLHEYATNFVTHWMEDDGNDDDEDKARCDKAAEDIDAAEDALAKALSSLTVTP